MKIILSPAKKMNVVSDLLAPQGMPAFLDQTEEILAWLRTKSYGELKKLWGCNDKIAEQNMDRLRHMDLHRNLTPAILSYEGIAYQYMAPSVFEDRQLEYVQEHLRILSAFYGVLKPADGVTPYRLEMQAKAAVGSCKNLYEKYLTKRDRYITITFCEESGGKLVTKGTYAKMARGEMVRFMAEKQIEVPEEIRNFDRLGYVFREDLTTDQEYVFERAESADAK